MLSIKYALVLKATTSSGLWTWCGYEEPWERINMGEHGSNTEFSLAAEI